MAIEIVDLPVTNYYFPQFCKSLPEGKDHKATGKVEITKKRGRNMGTEWNRLDLQGTWLKDVEVTKETGGTWGLKRQQLANHLVSIGRV